MINFIRIYFFSLGFLCFISYSEHLSVICNSKNYGSLPYILFVAAQNSCGTLDRPQCIARCSKFKMASLLLKNSIQETLFQKDNFSCERLESIISAALSLAWKR